MNAKIKAIHRKLKLLLCDDYLLYCDGLKLNEWMILEKACSWHSFVDFQNETKATKPTPKIMYFYSTKNNIISQANEKRYCLSLPNVNRAHTEYAIKDYWEYFHMKYLSAENNISMFSDLYCSWSDTSYLYTYVSVQL